jgi:stalled ribosome alternative rescue factor ArfA
MDDERFRARYEQIAPGLAAYQRDAMTAGAEIFEPEQTRRDSRAFETADLAEQSRSPMRLSS